MTVNLTDFKDMLIKEFVAADISLKIQVSRNKRTFRSLGEKTPSESSARSYILNHFANENFNDLEAHLYNKKFFLVVDEREIKKTRYFNILAGLITNPYKTRC
ncbi:hypothetical protein NGRA_3340 [Nosema granulosis]|uniref:Uncharacterized protein n=1 Tax=Nosema granulosis TaxID=83296 RepID=A0A9P6KXB1_9MICR|nr:hypothetical protein NGRA_3340 [Nosema granulosis]